MPELPASFGNVTAEYVTLRDEAALVEDLHELVWVRGEDTVRFLQGILSQDVAKPEPGEVTRTLLLQPNGKLDAVAWLLKGTDEIGLIVDAGFGEHVAGVLNRYRIRVKATIELEERSIIELWGKEARSTLRANDLPAPEGWERSDHGSMVANLPLGGLPRFLVVGAEVSAPRAGALAAGALRVEAGEPVVGKDLSASTIPQESGLVEHTVSFSKGCYLGQELVARIDSRGHVNRRLMGVVVETNMVPPTGAGLHVEGKEVGTLTSPVESLTLRAPIALGLVRREVEPGSQVEIRWEGGHTTGRVHDLPLSSFNET